jgi:hypothetical protein
VGTGCSDVYLCSMHAVDHIAREAMQLQTVIAGMTLINLSRTPLLPLFLDSLNDENFGRLRELGELAKLAYLQELFEAFLRGSRKSSF